ncbi:MAG: TIGR03790 family protein, partial [Verrucomicrobiota bacterium]
MPFANLIPLNVPNTPSLSRKEFSLQIHQPLLKRFTDENWWTLTEDANGYRIATSNQIRVLLLIRGIPYLIERTPSENKPEKGQQNEASVDSELALLGIQGPSSNGGLNNPYYKKDLSITEPALAPTLLTCRLDGPDLATCKRLVDDALAVEQTGLWGLCYLDQAKKGPGYELGDQWLANIATRNRAFGIPTIRDPFKNTFPTNYPMNEAALYYGWYSFHRDGPLLNPAFRFKKGAIAVHLHSLSAANLRDPSKNWVGPLLQAGATATLGNVAEPYLGLTHNLDLFHDRLLKGYSLAEAAHMAIPAHSWMSLLIGDPLYRPFLAHNQTPTAADDHKDYRAFRLAVTQWAEQPDTLTVKLRTAAARMSSGRLYESLGLRLLAQGENQKADAFFQSAATTYLGAPDKLHQTHHRVAILRTNRQIPQAVQLLNEAQERFPDLPESKSLLGRRNIIAPPGGGRGGGRGGRGAGRGRGGGGGGAGG